MSSTCPYNMVNLRPTSGWDRSGSLRHPCKFRQVSRLGSVTARHLLVGVSQTLRRWTEGATYVRQGDHHVGHWLCFTSSQHSLFISRHSRSFTNIILVTYNWSLLSVCFTLSLESTHSLSLCSQPHFISLSLTLLFLCLSHHLVLLILHCHHP